MTTVVSTQALAAERLHAKRYIRSEGWLQCRACGARIEPSMARVHARSPICVVRCGLDRARRLGLVRVEDTGRIDQRELDRAGLVVWIKTDYDDSGRAIEQSWTYPRIMDLVRDPSFVALDEERRREIMRGVSQFSKGRLAAMTTGEMLDV